MNTHITTSSLTGLIRADSFASMIFTHSLALLILGLDSQRKQWSAINSNNQLITGERARLIPVKKEEKTTASLLATFRVTPELAKAVWSGAGANIGSRAEIDCYNKVVFRSDEFKTSVPIA
ncbi:hypothetical protein GCM10022414_32880 [Zhongshania borealis]|uniref:Uncharacterized protein n=1 Tax=Zhongshania borealis TaxID=889488 RepID=A0ABP7X477_9GAMM